MTTIIETIDHGPVRELRMSRPPANALSPELIAELGDAVMRAPHQGARALVLSGVPGKFSGGLDIPLLIGFDRGAILATWNSFYRLMLELAASPIPVAAAITGHSPAGGAVLSIFCDYRIMAEGDYRIGLNEVQVGLPLPATILRAFIRLLGPHQAERLSVSGQLITAGEALHVGLVDELVPLDQVVPRAIEWCQGLLALPPRAMATTRRQARADLVRIVEEGAHAETEPLVQDWFSEETQSTMRALAEKLTSRRKS